MQTILSKFQLLMVLCFVIKYVVRNRKFIIITGANGEHCSKRNAAAQHQNKGFYS